MFEKIEAKIKEWWDNFWDWCHNSGTILMSYLYGIGGAITSFVGYFDLSPFWSFLQTGTVFTKPQLIGIGISVIGIGVTTYIVRTSKTKVVDDNLVPVSTPELQVKTKVTKKVAKTK